jgi:kynureninase
MQKGFIPMKGADGWQLSNMNILGTAGHIASLQIFEDAGWDRLLSKSRKLTSYLRFLLKGIRDDFDAFRIITPEQPSEHGCQLSLYFPQFGRSIFNFLTENRVVVDWREDNLQEGDKKERPGVIRVAPVPLYNSYQDVYQFSVLLKEALKAIYEKTTP